MQSTLRYDQKFKSSCVLLYREEKFLPMTYYNIVTVFPCLIPGLADFHGNLLPVVRYLHEEKKMVEIV